MSTARGKNGFRQSVDSPPSCHFSSRSACSVEKRRHCSPFSSGRRYFSRPDESLALALSDASICLMRRFMIGAKHALSGYLNMHR